MDKEQAEDDDGAADQFHMAAHAGGGICLVIVVLYVSE